MRFVSNAGSDRVLDLIRPWIQRGHQIDMVSPAFSLFAYSELLDELPQVSRARFVLPPQPASSQGATDDTLGLLGSAADRPHRNKLQAPWLSRKLAAWLEQTAEVRHAQGAVPQGTLVLRDGEGRAQQAVMGSFAFSTDGLGVTPGNPLSLIQASENLAEAQMLSQWFDSQWAMLRDQPQAKAELIERLRGSAATAMHRACTR